ncbi:Venom phosphodiesterase 1 [Liparis tanakae]|uniref:Venom phosphodiesterase 1 n=1 Tax=Liparis tanakae TaxID=230148 RepID=A0A4Z2GVS6_9TELE|nr:Venom phosphodiesterase 1 [Liparis tanakae]
MTVVVVPHTSCRGRCSEPYDGDVPGCRCDNNCNASGGCCRDYDDVCTVPTQQWECTALRCGETRLQQSRCHCSADCLAAADCCTNYKHVCHGEREWVKDECEDLSTPTCPSGFKQQPLLLVSLDGLRADYLQTWSALIPVLDKLKRCGTAAPFMQAAFPSKTFPNHYTIVTVSTAWRGRREESRRCPRRQLVRGGLTLRVVSRDNTPLHDALRPRRH